MTSPSRFVAILMGSDSDLPTMQATADVLAQFGIRYELNIKSAHRTPAAAQAYVVDAERRGCAVSLHHRPIMAPRPRCRSQRRQLATGRPR